jgi:hypothetical protein
VAILTTVPGAQLPAAMKYVFLGSKKKSVPGMAGIVATGTTSPVCGSAAPKPMQMLPTCHHYVRIYLVS